jgi:transposase
VLSPSRKVHVHLAVEPIDFRSAIDGLCGVVQNRLHGDALSGHLMGVPHNRRRTAPTLLFWDQGGYVLVHKRLARGRFRVPHATGAHARMTHAELVALLDGIDRSRCKAAVALEPAVDVGHVPSRSSADDDRRVAVWALFRVVGDDVVEVARFEATAPHTVEIH